jgi:NAD(P)-dependent dehydrogenase (short-subunit alcohol dehydrogenase family)
VTGAGGGIGGAAVRALAARGAEVLAQDLRPVAGEAGVSAVTSDLTTAEGVDAVRRAVGDAPLDVVVAAHGIEGSGALATLDPARARHILDIDFLTVVRLFAAVRPSLEAARGAFVVVASQAGLEGEANNGAYCAAKFALVGWARALAAEATSTGVRVRALCPGCTDTELLRGALEGMARDEGTTLEAMTARRAGGIPVGRLARPEEIAATALFLADLEGAAPAVGPVTGGEVLA